VRQILVLPIAPEGLPSWTLLTEEEFRAMKGLRYRLVTIDDAAIEEGVTPLCDCEGGHTTEAEALSCPVARRNFQ
jgi:hypothetical protein